VVDGGLGMAADDLAAANRRLANSIEVGPETTRRMGLFVVSRLAERHGVTVRLRPTYDTSRQAGITASVHVPAALIIADHGGDTAVLPVPKPATVAAARVLEVPASRVVELPASRVLELPAAREELPTRNWFVAVTEVDAAAEPPIPVKPAVPVVPASTWTPTPETLWHAADTALSPQPSALTAAGLPQRKPGARVLPVGQEHPPAEERPGFRDAESIRSNLSRHYDGVRAAREAAQAKSEAREGQ
jgi:hypothetical protein